MGADAVHDLDEWEFGPLIGRGGMGEVFLAWRGNQKAAVKFLRRDLAADISARQRFVREIEIALRVRGPHLARLLDFGVDEETETVWLASQYLPGLTLLEACRNSGPVPADLLPFVAAGLADAITTLHDVRVVHRDIKPNNVMITPAGDPVLIDLGVAAAEELTALTQDGQVPGTAGWMSPEQIAGGEVGPPSDVFSWGLTVAYAATGRHPFGTGPAEAMLYRITHRDPDLSALPLNLRGPVAAALDRTPGRRPVAYELAEAHVATPAQSRVRRDAWPAARDVTQSSARTAVGSPGRWRRDEPYAAAATRDAVPAYGGAPAPTRKVEPRPPRSVRRGSRWLVAGVAVGMVVALGGTFAWISASTDPGSNSGPVPAAAGEPSSSSPSTTPTSSTALSPTPSRSRRPRPADADTPAPVQSELEQVLPAMSGIYGSADPGGFADVGRFFTAHNGEWVNLDLLWSYENAVDSDPYDVGMFASCYPECDPRVLDAQGIVFYIDDPADTFQLGNHAWSLFGDYYVTEATFDDQVGVYTVRLLEPYETPPAGH